MKNQSRVPAWENTNDDVVKCEIIVVIKMASMCECEAGLAGLSQ